jgi:rare lipoprotein A
MSLRCLREIIGDVIIGGLINGGVRTGLVLGCLAFTSFAAAPPAAARPAAHVHAASPAAKQAITRRRDAASAERAASREPTPASPNQATLPPPDSSAAQKEAENLDRLPPIAPHGRTAIDHSGRKQKGRASYYARWFARRKMANGRPMNPNANVVASKTLPLGTTAAVTNLDNGRTATVKVEDRGPFVDGRVVDVSPKVARELDISRKQGVAPVVVKPITVPQADGLVKLGAGAAEATPQEVRQATEATQALVDDGQAETASRR